MEFKRGSFRPASDGLLLDELGGAGNHVGGRSAVVGTLWRGGKFHALRARSGPSAGRLSRHVRISRRGGEASPREGPAMVRRYRPGARRRPIIRISANPLASHTSSHMITLSKSEGEAICARGWGLRFWGCTVAPRSSEGRRVGEESG